MNTFGMAVVFCLGAFGGIIYAMMAVFGFASSSGLLDEYQGFETNAGTYYICFMFIVPLIAINVWAIIEPSPGGVGFALASTSSITYMAYQIVKRIRLERLSQKNQ